MIRCLRKGSKRVISARFSGCKHTLLGGINWLALLDANGLQSKQIKKRTAK